MKTRFTIRHILRALSFAVVDMSRELLWPARYKVKAQETRHKVQVPGLRAQEIKQGQGTRLRTQRADYRNRGSNLSTLCFES